MIDKKLLEERQAVCAERTAALPSLESFRNKPETACAVDIALRFVKECRANACGKSVPCRDGLWQLEELLGYLTSGKAEEEAILDTIEDILDFLMTTGCDYAAGCAERVKLSMELYRQEYLEHVKRRCAAMVCTAYCNLYIDPALCNGCGKCKEIGGWAVDGSAGMIHIIKNDGTLKTPEFMECCPVGAVKKWGGFVKPRVPDAPVPVGSFAVGGEAGGRRSRRRG